MFPVLIIECARPGLLYVNGMFCGELTDAQILPVRPDGRVYVEYRMLSEPALPLAVAMDLVDGQVRPTLPLSAYVVQWPDRVIGLELRPMPLPRAPAPREVMATLSNGGVVLSHQRIGEEQAVCLGDVPLFTLPESVRDLRVHELSGGALVFGIHEAGESAWLLSDAAGRGLTMTDRVNGEQITLEGEDRLRVLASAGDGVGHGYQIQYQIRNGRLHSQNRENVWLPGAPRWPQAPQETLHAYLDALRHGTADEAAAFLTPQAAAERAASPLPAFDAAVSLPRPLMSPPSDHPLAMGLLTRQTPNLGTVRAVCARAVAARHAQGAYQLESVTMDRT